MADEAYKLKQDTSLPRAIALIGEDELQGKIYETEGRTYDAGTYVLADDISPPVREAIERGDYDAVLEPASRSDYDEWIDSLGTAVLRVPEHSVEHLALVQDGKKIVDRETAIQLRSLGSDDVAKAIEDAKADGADERPNLSFETAPDPGADDGEATVGSHVKDADDLYVDEDAAKEAAVQVTPSGIVAVNTAATEEQRPRERPTRRERPTKSETGAQTSPPPGNKPQGQQGQ